MRSNRFKSLLLALCLLGAVSPAQAAIEYIYDKAAKPQPALSLKEQRHWSKIAADQSCSEIFWSTPQEDLSKKDNLYCLDDNDLHNAHDYAPFKDVPAIQDTLVTARNTLLVVKEDPALRYIKLKYFVERDVPADAVLSSSVINYEKYKLLLNLGGDTWQTLLETISKRDNNPEGGDAAVTKSTVTLVPSDKGTIIKHTYQGGSNPPLDECYALDETNHLYNAICPIP